MESGGKVFTASLLQSNRGVEEAGAVPTLARSGVSAGVASNGKNDIKISEEGVAKLTFSFLDDMQGDSSLEPGEVKTPPPGSSPASNKESTPMRSSKAEPPAKVLAREKLAKALKTVSQMEAEACEEKVRLILELDAKRRKEEKMEMEKRRRIGEESQEEKEKIRSKEERKKLKELKRAHRAAKKALRHIDMEDDSQAKLGDDSATSHGSIKRKASRRSQSEDSEGLCSSAEDGNTEDIQKYEEKVPSLVSVVNTIVIGPRFPPHMAHQTSHPTPHLPPDAFMGYRGMNPFMRGPRVDFSHGRGGFAPRGRGGPRGRMPFSGFRPPFFAGPSGVGVNPNVGGLLPRHHGPQHRPHHTPPPNRGHSPIMPPSTNLQWTKCKPSISYAFKMDQEHRQYDNPSPQPETKHNLAATTKSQLMSDGGKESCDNEDGDEVGVCQQNPKKKKTSKEKKKKSPSSKDKKTSKKLKENKKHLRKSTTLSVSFAKSSKKKKNKKSSRRKIEKIRKSYDSRKSSEDTETSNCTQEETSDKEEYIPDAEEIRNKVQNMKVEKVDTATELRIEDITLKVRPLIMIKQEPTDKDEENKEEEHLQNDTDKSFDMFADSPPRPRKSKRTQNIDSIESSNSASGSATPPLPIRSEHTIQKPPALQNAIDIQKRIDKILQQDDIKLEAIEAAKEMLMRKTLKHQSTKDKQHHSVTTAKDDVDNQKPKRDPNDGKISKESTKSAVSKDDAALKEKPNAYKEKRSLSQTAKHGDDGQHRDSSKKRETSKNRDEKDRRDRKYGRKTSSTSKDNKCDDKGSCISEYSKEKSSHRTKNYQEKDKYYKDSSSKQRNPFKHSMSRDRFSSKIENRRRSRTKSRDTTSKGRLSDERKRSDSSGKVPSKRRRSESGIHSGSLTKPKSCDRDIKSPKNYSKTEKTRKEKQASPHIKAKDKAGKSSTSYLEKDVENKLKQKQDAGTLSRSITAPSKILKTELKTSKLGQESTKLEQMQKKRPLSFSQSEFLSPKEDESTDCPLNDDSQEYSSPTKSPSDKEDSPDTDDYMDNWENDEDVDIDQNSNAPGDSSTPKRTSPETTEEDSFVTRFVNPSPPSELAEKQGNIKEDTSEPVGPTTPPLSLLSKIRQEKLSISEKEKQTQLFGMQELYDQFIKSVEASGVEIKDTENEPILNDSVESGGKREGPLKALQTSEEPLSTSSTSTSSASSSSSSSSEYNSSSSSSSSSATSSDDSNDVDSYSKSFKNTSKKQNLEELIETSSNPDLTAENKSSVENTLVTLGSPEKTVEREPRTPSPTPLQRSLLIIQTPPTPASQMKAPKSDVAKDFKKLKSLEANLSRIQMMRANYDSKDEISEELHKMEMLFLQEKKLILQKYAKSTSRTENSDTESFVQSLPSANRESDAQFTVPPPPPPEPEIDEHNKIFDANREAIKLTISPMKLPSKSAIFQASITEDLEKKMGDDKEEADFTEKFAKPAKEVAIVKPMMETKETQESRSRDSQRHRRSPVYVGGRDRPRTPTNCTRDRNRRSSSRSRFSPQRRSGRGRSLSISPPRRNLRHATPPRRGGLGSRFRVAGRRSRSRSRSRSPVRQFAARRGKDNSPLRSRKGSSQAHYKKFTRTRGSRSRSPRSPQRPRSPRTPPPRRRSYSPDRYSPLPFKPPSPPMQRSHSPLDCPHSPTRRSRSPHSPRRPRSPRSPPSPRSPRSPRSPVSPPHSSRFDDHRCRRENSFERHSSISPQNQYYPQGALSAGVASAGSPYYYDVSPNRISLDARINIVLNGPGGHETPSTGYDDYSNYAQYGGAAYMSIPPQPMSDPSGAPSGYYPNPYVSMLPPPHAQGQHHLPLPPPQHMQAHVSTMPPHHHTPHPSTYSNIPTINSGLSQPHTPSNQYYYNDFPMGHQNTNPVLKELPKVSSVAVQKGNVLEIVPSNDVGTSSPAAPPSRVSSSSVTTTPAAVDKESTKKVSKVSLVSWKEEVNNRHVKSAVMRLTRESDNTMRSILKRSDIPEKTDKIEKKKVYFEDGIYPSRDSEDEDRKLVEEKIRRKVLRLRKKRGIDIAATTRELLGDIQTKHKSKVEIALEKLPPPPPPKNMPPANLEQPIYLRPPTAAPLVYFHFDSMVHSMYVSQLEKPIPPRLLNPKCGPPPGPPSGPPPPNAMPLQQSPNINSPTSLGGKKDLATLAALNRASRSEAAHLNSPKMLPDQKRDSPISGPPDRHLNKSHPHYSGPLGSPQMHTPPPVRHFSPPMGFVGMRINNFMRLPPSPLTRGPVPPFMHPNMPVMALRHHQFNMPPPGMPHDNNYLMPQYPSTHRPPPGFMNMHQRPPNPGYFMGSPSMHHPPPPIPIDKDNYPHEQARVVSPQAMIAPYNVKKTVN